MTIENLEKTLWKFEGFVMNLKIQRLSNYLELCHNLKYDEEFNNVCHRAKREVEQLVLNDKNSLIKVYYKKFQYYFDELESWRKNKLKDERNFNQVNISMFQIHDVFDNLKFHYTELFPKETKDKELHSSQTIEKNNMFAVSKTKRKFSDYSLKEIKSYTKDKEKHKYDLLNESIYHKTTGELIKEEKIYNTGFIFQLIGMNILDVKKFLNYQYSNSKNKVDLFTFIKYGVAFTPLIKHEGTKEQIKDWVQEIENNELSVQQSAAEPHREEQEMLKEFKSKWTTHEKLFNAVIFAVDETQNQPIEGGYEILKQVWFFLNSDTATFNGKEIVKTKRPLLVNPIIKGKADFDGFFNAEISYCSKENNIQLVEEDFITDLSKWIKRKTINKSDSIARQRKYNEFLAYLDSKFLQLKTKQESTDEPHPKEKPKYFAKHYVLAYLFDCDANNESYPVGNKKELERIGNERMGNGKGNTFYKNFNSIINDPNFNIKNEAYLIDLVGENWINTVTKFSKNTELVKKHIEETNIE